MTLQIQSPKLLELETQQKQVQVQEGFDFILSHFEPPIWPIRISTALYNGAQVMAHDRQQVLAYFKAANYVNCRINAYSALYSERKGNGLNRQAPNLIFVDIDRESFKKYKDPQRSFNSAVKTTLKNFKEKLPGSCPTVLDTGNGYHFYQPIFAPFVLEREEVFTKLESQPSREFLRFAEQFLSNKKSDSNHKPSLLSCLLRIPGSINSKCGKQVKIISEWNGQRPAINYLLNDFRKYLIQKDIDRYHELQKYAKTKTKTKQSSVHVHANNNSNSIEWIESNILQGNGISDYRKTTIDLILAPYLVNVKKCDYDTAYNIIIEWLDKCAKKRSLDFNAKHRLDYTLRHVKDRSVLWPMRQETMKEKYPEMYQEIFSDIVTRYA